MSLFLRLSLTTLLCLILPAAIFAEDATPTQQLEFFETKIRPVLIESCYECHNSHDAAEGDFAIDHRKALLAGGASGAVVVPGKPDESRLLAILRHEIAGMEMPQGGPKLDDAVLKDFRDWIAAGAFDPRQTPPSAEEAAAATSWKETLKRRKAWWSFQPITHPQPPVTNDPQWDAHPIDRFVHQKHQELKLEPSELASPAVLVRRLYFNLTGLPPSPAEAQQWVDRLVNASPEQRDTVYGELVDSLLESPHFGERWARHWMDWTRYAESHGSEGDPPIVGAWAYRDYLIRAINADVPVDQLIREHVAGDLLSQPRVNEALGINESAIGPAHWRMVFHGFLPTDALDERVRFTDDQINCFSKAFLGLTVSCARCHDHKFDPISQADYYALYGVLASCRPAQTSIELPSRTESVRAELAQLKQEIRRAVSADWLASLPDIDARLSHVSTKSQVGSPDQSPFDALVATQGVLGDGPGFAAAWEEIEKSWNQQPSALPNYETAWNLADAEDYADWFPQGTGLAESPSQAGFLALEVAGDYALRGIYPSGVYSHGISDKLPAHLASPNITLKPKAEVWVQAIGDGAASFRYVVQNYPLSGGIYPIRRLSPTWQWVRFDADYWAGDSIHLELTTAMDAPNPNRNEPRSWFGARRAIIRYPGQPEPKNSAEWLPAILPLVEAKRPTSHDELKQIYAQAIKDAIQAWQDNRLTDAQALLLQACLQKEILTNRLDALSQAAPLVERYRQMEGTIPVPRRVPGLDESRGTTQPLYVRGDPKQLGESNPRRFLEAIDTTPYTSEQSGRLELADDLLREDNPLTRRVMVNRVWHHLLGQGLVRTPDNLGKMGDQPSNVLLLDWLARHFAEEGWSLKQLVREIVTTRTWQLASQATPEQLQNDADNRYLTRAHVRRMEAEVIRDALLAVSGQLDETIYGEPVTADSARRSVYLEVIRNELNPLLRVFDFPEPFSTVGRRDVTNVPAQSLTLLNDPQVKAYADAWGSRTAAASFPNDQDRIQAMFQTAFGRAARSEEVSQSEAYLAAMAQRQREVREQAAQIEAQLASLTRELNQRKDPIRRQLEREHRPVIVAASDKLPEPIAHWDFSRSAADQIGTAHGKLMGDAIIENGALRLSGNGYFVTPCLTDDLTEKTLEAWLQLDDLSQSGGGVLSVQTPDGNQFDAIVFGEQEAGHWLAGSNSFARTKSFQASPETEADRGPVHVAIVYQADGTIAAYRNGEPYGEAYQSAGVYSYSAGNTVVTLGLRHLPGIGNRFLHGQIFQARLYDHALSREQIRQTAKLGPIAVTDQHILAAMDADTRAQVAELTGEIGLLRNQLAELSAGVDPADEQMPWKELARALITMKEFIYVR